MGQSNKVKYFLVHGLKLTNKEAAKIIASGRLSINNIPVNTNQTIGDRDKIELDNKIVKQPKEFVYIKFHKPRGYESTLNKEIEKNISSFLPEIEGLSIAGRLDKYSEGLLLLSNDGKWVQQICLPQSKKEKTYIVELAEQVTDEFISAFSGGVDVGIYKTQPCVCKKMGDFTIEVILTEGKNKQIRRVCKTLKNKVLKLKRTKIDCFELGSLEVGVHELTKI